jgi:hypothetical protein
MYLLSLEGGHGGSSRRTRPPEPELLRCICGKVITRAEVEYRRSYCPRGHMGQWQLVVIILSLYETNNWIPSCPITVGVYNTTKITTSPVNAFTVLTCWTRLHTEGYKTSGVTRLYSAPHFGASRLGLLLWLFKIVSCVPLT